MKEIILKNKKICYLDDIDADLCELKWWYCKGYANRWTKGSVTSRTHYTISRLILERILQRPLKDGENCDHIDHDRLNNRRNNLRVCTHAENARNRTKRKNTTSIYKGVYFHRGGKRRKRWAGQIVANGKRLHIGFFHTENEAGIAYNKVAVEMHGEFASLNEIKSKSCVVYLKSVTA